MQSLWQSMRSRSTISNEEICQAESSKRGIKCVVVGTTGVGKTSLLSTLTKGSFLEYVPLVLVKCVSNISVNGKQVSLDLWDTNGKGESRKKGYYYCYESRLESYPNTDVILLCFSLVCPTSYEEVVSRWYPEIREHCPYVPIILVGTKLDLHSNPQVIENLRREDSAPLTTADGLELAERIGCQNYVECSALRDKGVKTVFVEAVRATGGYF